jgi:hypothetical protein
MQRRDFAKSMGAVAAGLVAGSRVLSGTRLRAEEDKAPKHVCRGHNECSGKGGCKTAEHTCAGKNSCKGKGGCASAAARHECAAQNKCKGMGGCKTTANACAGKNDCKGKGGCKVPLKSVMKDPQAPAQ